MVARRMEDITSMALPSVPLIKVYSKYCVLNSRAMKLLGITKDQPYIRVTRLAEERRKDRLYVGRSSEPSQFEVVRYDGRQNGRINSIYLAREISECLQGYGIYRICPDYYQLDIAGDKYYEIFFKNIKPIK